MAGKAKSCYLTVSEKGTHRTMFTKMFFKSADMNDYIKTPEFTEKYPEEKFNYVKETY